MRARMLVDARVLNSDPDNPVAVFSEGQEIEGAYAETQVALGHAEALPETSEEATEEAAAADVAATKAAQTHAEALGVDLSTVEGSGSGGTILKSDVVAAATPAE